ncbi:MAG: TnsD family Tn7-like transposition protein [Chloroflexota bacterium]
MQQVLKFHYQRMGQTSTLGVGIDTLKRQAKRLGLLHDANISIVETFDVSQIKQLKAKWLQILVQHPDLGIAELIKTHGEIYWELYKCCIDWLLDNSPDKRYASKYQEKDWATIDCELQPKVAPIAEELRRNSPPQRITINIIAMQLGWKDGSVYKDLAKIPVTKQAIEAEIETSEQFAIRRIDILASQFHREKYTPTKAEYIKKAGLSRSIQTVSVTRHLERKLNQLQKYSRG